VDLRSLSSHPAFRSLQARSLLGLEDWGVGMGTERPYGHIHHTNKGGSCLLSGSGEGRWVWLLPEGVMGLTLVFHTAVGRSHTSGNVTRLDLGPWLAATSASERETIANGDPLMVGTTRRVGVCMVVGETVADGARGS